MKFDNEKQKLNLLALLRPQLQQAQVVLETCQAINDGTVDIPKPKKGKKNA